MADEHRKKSKGITKSQLQDALRLEILENAPAIIGLGRAAELALEHMEEEQTRVAAMRDRVDERLEIMQVRS